MKNIVMLMIMVICTPSYLANPHLTAKIIEVCMCKLNVYFSCLNKGRNGISKNSYGLFPTKVTPPPSQVERIYLANKLIITIPFLSTRYFSVLDFVRLFVGDIYRYFGQPTEVLFLDRNVEI